MISLEYCAAGPYRVTAYRLPQYPTSPPPLSLAPPSALRHLYSFSSLAMQTYTLRMHVCVCYSLQPIVNKNKSMIYFWIRRYYLYSIRLLRVLSH